jgi:hypothetical protein
MHGLVDRVVLDRKQAIGDVIGPVMGPGGQTIYHLVDRKFREEVTFEDVRDRIAESMRLNAGSRSATNAIAELRAQVKVECVDAVLCAAPARPEGSPLTKDPPPPSSPLEPALDDGAKKILSSANHCDRDDECVSIGAICPIACHVAVHRSEKDRVLAALTASPSRCSMMCTDGVTPTCVAHRCVDRR